jgi:hypothetical protein
MSLKDFEVKKIFDVDDLVLNIILTPKYVVMHDDENTLNWVTSYEEPYYTTMTLEKRYKVEGGMLSQFFYNHGFDRLILN